MSIAEVTGAAGCLWLPPSAAAFGHLGSTPQLQAAALAAHLEVRLETVRSVFREPPTVEDVLRYTKSLNSGLRGKAFEYAVFFAIELGVEDVVWPIAAAMERIGVEASPPQAIMVVLDRGSAAATALVGAFDARAGTDPRIVNGRPGPDPRLSEARIRDLHDAYMGRGNLPASIGELAKADLLLGDQFGGRWLAAQLKLNTGDLRPQQGVLLGVTADGSGDAPARHERSNMMVARLDRRSLFLTATDNAHEAVRRASSWVKDGGRFTSSTIDQWAAFLIDSRGELADFYLGDLRRRAGLEEGLILPGASLVTAATAFSVEEAAGPVTGVALDRI